MGSISVNLEEFRHKREVNMEKTNLDQQTLSRLGFGLNINRFLTFLSWNGIVHSIIGIIAGVAILCLPTDMMKLHGVSREFNPHVVALALQPWTYIFGAVLLIFSLIWLVLNINLKKNIEKMTALKRICNFISGMDIFIWCVYSVILIISMARSYGFNFFSLILIFILFIVFESIQLHGIRVEKRSFTKAFVIFIYVMLTLFLGVYLGAALYFAITYQLGFIFFLGLLYCLFIFYSFISIQGYIIALDGRLMQKEESLLNINKSTSFEYQPHVNEV